jgi:CDP-glycerol glycerophosphotransferase
VVARFTFTTGNVKKVLAIPLYALGNLASLVVPRTGGLWVFGSGSGVGEGSLALLQHARAVDPALRIVWLARNTRDTERAASLGIESVTARSPRGFWLTLRARVVVVTHGFGDANRFGVRGAYVVQLWHGIPFKHIHLDSPETLRVPVLSRFGVVRRAIRRAYVSSARGIRLFATASPLAAARIRTAFDLPADRIVITGDPRDDVLATEARDGARAQVAALLGEVELPPRLVLYAPTWRDGADDPLVPGAGDWPEIVEYLTATDSMLLVRSHPLGAGDYSVGAKLSPRIRMLGSNLQGDITPLLPAMDALITDYSSIAFDYSLVGSAILFLAPDVVTYSTSRGSYEPFSDFSGGFEATDWSGVIAMLRDRDSEKATRDRMTGHARWLAGRVYSFHDGRNAARVYDEIRYRLGDAAQPDYRVPALPVEISSIELSDGAAPVLSLAGRATGRMPAAVQLVGPRVHLRGTISTTGTSWTAAVPLVTSRLGAPPLPPPSGRYRVRLLDGDGRVLDASFSVVAPAPGLRAGLFRFRVLPFDTGVTIDLGAPLADNEVGAANQSRLESAYRRVRRATQASIFFESYYGQNVSSNPRGIDRAVARLLPELTRYWSVVDASVEVPDGATAILEGSEAWWQARASSRALVVNDWLRKRFRRRAGQTVLQTWHGTPLKQLALDRPGVRLRAALATRRERAHWSIMLAQNQFSADIFRSAYAFRGPIWQEGYPRDDILRTGDGASVRARLGIAAAAKVVLYAPTWRDDRPGKIDHLDVARFGRELGPDYVTLIRGHSRSLQPGNEIEAAGVLDVTSYPDISDLFLIADALVTDYSSVMFDFSVTGKPLYFFTPDLEHYRDELRGFYFDLLADAPGPVLSDPAELVRAILEPHQAAWAARYAAWQARFNPRDDGNAGDRVVRRMLEEGIL